MTPPAPTPEQVIAAWWDHPEPVMHPDDVRSAKRVLALFAQALADAQVRVAALEKAVAHGKSEIAHRIRLIFKDSEIFYKVREIKACLDLADELDRAALARPTPAPEEEQG